MDLGPQIIVCATKNQFLRAKKQTRNDPYTTVSDGKSANDILARCFYRVIICEGVDLNRDVQGEGSLGSLLKKRQATYTHPIWVEL